MFYRLSPDGSRRELNLAGLFAGPTRTPCWILGGGPSLAALPTDEIAATPIARFAMNLAGHGLLRPTFWTSYDPTCRFLKSIYLDPSITKFVHRQRAMDLIPETTFKVCESPATFCFDRAPRRGFHNFPAPEQHGRDDWQLPDHGQPETNLHAITDWQDSLIQTIDIAYRLGFRTLYLAGCELEIRPSPAQVEAASAYGVTYHSGEPLRTFYQRCRKAGLKPESAGEWESVAQYHFDESKPLAAAVQTDWHYFRVVQYLRLARRAMALAGLELISVTPASRLNSFFDYQPVEQVLATIANQIGDPAAEQTRGRYTSDRAPDVGDAGLMRDFAPHNWNRPPTPALPPATAQRGERLRNAIEDLPEVAVPLTPARPPAAAR